MHLPIEQRYNKANYMFHSGAFVAAGTIISVGAAAAGTAMSVSAADKAAKAQAAAGKKMDKRMGSAQERLVEQLAQIKEPQWDVARDIADARQITGYNINQLEKIFPGAKGQRQIAARATESYLKGEIPKDVQDQIMRSVAEMGGAGFAPTQAGVPHPHLLEVSRPARVLALVEDHASGDRRSPQLFFGRPGGEPRQGSGRRSLRSRDG